jgi:hypothetical protein
VRLRGTVGTVQDNTGTAVAQSPRRNRTGEGGWMVAATEDELGGDGRRKRERERERERE